LIKKKTSSVVIKYHGKTVSFVSFPKKIKRNS